MKKISTLYQFEELVGYIIRDEKNLFASIKDMDDNLNIFKVYDKVIELISNHLKLEVTLTDVPFFMKLDIVSCVINKVLGEEGITAFLQKIHSTPFDSDSKLLTAVKNDYKVCTPLANLGVLVDHYEWPYHLINHMHENISSVPRNDYSTIIHDISNFLSSLSAIIQKKLYNDDTRFLNRELMDFTFSFMKIGSTEKGDTLTYQRLSAEYPEILKVYDTAVNTLKVLQNRNLILV